MKHTFIRWGGLSPKNVKRSPHKKDENGLPKEKGYHYPPVKKGIYAFHEGWVEWFLVSWKLYKYLGQEEGYKRISLPNKKRVFQYEGKIWTHMHYIHPEIRYYRESGSWFETHTDCLDKLLKLEYQQLRNGYGETCKDWGCPESAFNDKNVKKHYSLDHVEFFIEKVK